MSPNALDIPSFTAAEIKEEPAIVVEIAIWKILATAVESDAIEPQALAGELNKLFPTNRPGYGSGPRGPEKSEGYLWAFWEIFAQAASQLPVEHTGQDRLVAVIGALRDLPNPVPVPMLDEVWGPLKLWSDLPIMGPAFREALDVDSGINLEAFLIRLTVAGLGGFEWLGLGSLREALEMPPEPRSTAYDKRGDLLDSAIPRAALWIQLAGAKLYECCLAEKLRDASGTRLGSWKGQTGFSKQRWNTWKIKFLEICGDRQASRKTKDLAWDAMSYMNYVDGSMLE